MRIPRHLLQRVGAVLFFGFTVIAILTLYLSWNGQLRFLSNGSKLGLFETRIESVEEEFMRRSPELRENFTRFDQCVRNPACNPESIFRERDLLLQAIWPDLLARLMVTDDWGEGRLTVSHHRQFTRRIRHVGGPEQAKRCRPVFKYYNTNNMTTYSFRGLRCHH